MEMMANYVDSVNFHSHYTFEGNGSATGGQSLPQCCNAELGDGQQITGEKK